MNRPSQVAADVRRLTLSQRVLREKDQSPSTGSGCTSLPRLLREIGGFMVPMRVPYRAQYPNTPNAKLLEIPGLSLKQSAPRIVRNAFERKCLWVNLGRCRDGLS